MAIELGTDEWSTSSGLALSNADVEVVACSFGYNAKLGADALCANFTFSPTEGGELIEQSFSVGKGWEAKDNGDSLVSEDGRGRSVNKSTNYGMLIDAAVAAVQAAGEDMPFASPRIASGWIGTQWHMGTTQVVRMNPTTKVEVVKDAFVFSQYLGVTGGSTTAAAPATSSTGSKAKAAAAPGNGIDPELYGTLLGLAREHSDDHDAFVEAALLIDGVDGVSAVEKLVLKAKGANSIFAEANG